MPEQRDERELHAELELGTPNWLPGGKLAFRFRRLWDKRVDMFVERAAMAAGVDIPTLSTHATRQGQLSDVFMIAAHRAGERGDEYYQDVLSGLVAAALLDDARIDTIAYVLDRIVKLEPIHVRILSLFLYETLSEANAAGNLITKRVQLPEHLNLSTRTDHASKVDTEAYALVLRTDPAIIESCLLELQQLGFTGSPDAFQITKLGTTAGLLINDVLRDIQTLPNFDGAS